METIMYIQCDLLGFDDVPHGHLVRVIHAGEQPLDDELPHHHRRFLHKLEGFILNGGTAPQNDNAKDCLFWSRYRILNKRVVEKKLQGAIAHRFQGVSTIVVIGRN